MSSPESIPTNSDCQKLPREIWAAIAKRLTSITDYISFRGVCRSWRSAANFGNFDRAFPRIPWLMYVHKEKEAKEDEQERIDDVKKALTNFLDIETQKTKATNFPPPVGIPHLSWSGWVLHVSSESVDVTLTHPIWGVEIDLPGTDTFPKFERRDADQDNRDGEDGKPNIVISKMVLSGSPTIKIDLVVMVIWGDEKQLGFSRPGDESWSVMGSWDGSFSDVVYYNRRLYAVDSSARVVECDVHGSNPTQLRQVFVLPETDRGFVLPEFEFYVQSEFKAGYYLVESCGKILLVSRHYRSHTSLTVGFRVFEVELNDGSHNEIHDLGNRALFLGCNSSICVELSGCSKVEPNRVYFMNDIGVCKLSGMGVYRLLNKRMERMNWLLGEISDAISPTATWVVPSF